MFKRRPGTAGICGHLYETKLLSLLYFRAINDERILDFKLASNVDNVGAFDDICFKAVVDPKEGCDRPVCLFIQAKHKENEKRTLRIDLETYFVSYLKIRQQFNPSNDDLFFSGTFDETECLFVIYTTAKDEIGNNPVTSSFSSHLYDLIGTGGSAKQVDLKKEDVESLSKVALENQITSLAARIAKLTLNEDRIDLMLSEELLLRYHVILAQKVLEVSEIQPEGHRVASFRPEFFDNPDEYFILFKNALYKEILEIRQINPTDVESLLSEFLAASTDDETEALSKLIGTVVVYNNGQLNISEHYKQHFRPELNRVNVSPTSVNKAVERAAKQILLSANTTLRVPASFGNKDLTLSSNDTKKERRINYLKTEIISLINKYKASKIVTVDESLASGLLKLNGGLAGAIGNIFVLDDNTKLMKITDNKESLGTLARILYDRLNREINNLLEYRFYFKVSKFPRLLFERGSYEDGLVRDFLHKLIIYSNQADEKLVAERIKDEIEEELQESDNSKNKIEAIFLKYHNEIQTWWMLPKEAPYLTREDRIFERATSYIIEDPLMRSMSVPFIKKITQFYYSFSEDAVRSLNLQDDHSSTVIIAVNTVLTVVKVMQYLKNKDYVVLDLGDIVNLPTNERNALRKELASTNQDKVLILVCNQIQDSITEKKTFENVAAAVRYKNTIIVTNRESVHELRRYFIECEHTVYDWKNSLVHMSGECQRVVLEIARVKFQGIEVGLGHLVRGWTGTVLRARAEGEPAVQFQGIEMGLGHLVRGSTGGPAGQRLYKAYSI